MRALWVVLYEPRVEPLIPARFGDFLEVRPGSRFDHKGANRFGKRNSSQKSKLPSKNQIKLRPNRIHIIFRMGNYGEHKFMDSTCPELIKLCTFSGGFFCHCNSIIQYLLMKVRFGSRFDKSKVRPARGSVKGGFIQHYTFRSCLMFKMSFQFIPVYLQSERGVG